ncbi:hypothetical protein FOA52_013817 [Chlamydomonas sp. UWO 241]|nr:hypothetical protein FOA52_013817 [Chlamydomonas sp. UWO 241]
MRARGGGGPAFGSDINDYAAAAEAAAAAAAATPGGGGGGGVAQRDAHLSRARERLLELATGGLVAPVPFLPAGGAQPLALLDAPGVANDFAGAGGDLPPVDLGMHPNPPSVMCGVDARVHAFVAGLAARAAAAQASRGGAGPRPSELPGQLPDHVLAALTAHPELQNAMRTAAFNAAGIATASMPARDAAAMTRSVAELSELAQCVLWLGST